MKTNLEGMRCTKKHHPIPFDSQVFLCVCDFLCLRVVFKVNIDIERARTTLDVDVVRCRISQCKSQHINQQMVTGFLHSTVAFAFGLRFVCRPSRCLSRKLGFSSTECTSMATTTTTTGWGVNLGAYNTDLQCEIMLIFCPSGL